MLGKSKAWIDRTSRRNSECHAYSVFDEPAIGESGGFVFLGVVTAQSKERARRFASCRFSSKLGRLTLIERK